MNQTLQITLMKIDALCVLNEQFLILNKHFEKNNLNVKYENQKIRKIVN